MEPVSRPDPPWRRQRTSSTRCPRRHPCRGHRTKGDPALRSPRGQRLEPLYDGVLLVYACLVYSAVWGALFRSDEPVLSAPNVPMLILNLVAGSILFMALYLPLRIPYWTEEFARSRTPFGRLKLVRSLLSAIVPALISL